METCSGLNCTFVKEEPLELSTELTSLDEGQGIGQHCRGLCSQGGSDLSTTVDVEEINLKYFKSEEIIGVKNNPQNVEQLAAGIHRRPIVTDHMQALKIAKAYADLFSNNTPHLFPYQILKSPTFLFQCPRCMLPCKCASPSAFLTLLHHVSEKHPENSMSLFACIMKQYAPFIDLMKKRIALKTKHKYFLKLRGLNHRREILRS